MKQFANIIELTPSFRVSSVVGNSSVVMKSGFTQDRFTTSNDVEPTEELSRNAAGNLYSFGVNVTIDKLSASQKEIYASNPPVILTLMDSDTGAKLVIGTPTNPCSISLTPGVEHDQLRIERPSKVPVL